jgi:hypothetical protein
MSKKSEVSDTLRGMSATAFGADNNRALINATETWLAASTQCHREMIGFMSMRLAKDNDTVREMLGCKNLADATALQTRWVEETMRDYHSEMTKLMEICAKSANGGMRPGA